MGHRHIGTAGETALRIQRTFYSQNREMTPWVCRKADFGVQMSMCRPMLNSSQDCRYHPYRMNKKLCDCVAEELFIIPLVPQDVAQCVTWVLEVVKCCRDGVMMTSRSPKLGKGD
jgi:hypothetical protein